jgi:hypothetical protein
VAIIEDMDDSGFGMAGDASDSDVGNASRAGHHAAVPSFAAPAAMSAAQELQTRAVFHELLAHVRGMRRRCSIELVAWCIRLRRATHLRAACPERYQHVAASPIKAPVTSTFSK